MIGASDLPSTTVVCADGSVTLRVGSPLRVGSARGVLGLVHLDDNDAQPIALSAGDARVLADALLTLAACLDARAAAGY